MEKILQLAKGKGLILSIDSNSGKYTVVLHEHESKFLEEFMITSNLLIMSEATDIPTFETTRGRSWIDLTLCNNILATKPVDARAARKKPAPTIRMYFSLLKLWKSVAMQNITQGNSISRKQMIGELLWTN